MLRSVVLGVLIVFAQSGYASKVRCTPEVSFEKEISLQMDPQTITDLKLNGVGLRIIFIFQVFYGALYVETVSQDGEEHIQSPETKALTLHLLVPVSRERLLDEWNKEFDRLCEDQCDEMRPFHEKFTSYARDFKIGERMTVVFRKDRVDFITGTDEFFDPIRSGDYGKIMLKSAMGKVPSSKGFRKGILGRKKVCKR